MYELFYELRSKPFSILPDPDLIYWGKAHSMAFTMLEFGVMNNAGFTVITGEIGSGKTTLVRRLLKSLPPNISTGLVSNSPQGRQELLQWILMSLGRPFDGDYPELFKHFQDFLHGQYAGGRRTMLVIDEAQNLEPEALEHLRMLSNINADKHQILQLILVGQPQLRDGVAGAATASICTADFVRLPSQGIGEEGRRQLHRVPAGIWLAPRRRRGRFSASKPAPRSPPPAAGIPRMINILCDTALVYGFARGEKTITGQARRPTSLQTSNSTVFFH